MDRPPLDADRLRELLGARWSRVEVVEETASTNADLLAAHEAPDRSLSVAEHQVSGRGRFDRVWASPPRAGLTFSVLLRPATPVGTWGWLPLLTGVALAEAVTTSTSVPVGVKWPNDLLCAADGRKLAGVLAQATGEAAVVGIGLNVSTTRAELPIDTATSLELAGATEVDRTSLLAAIVTALDGWVTRWDDAGGDADACGLAAACRAACTTLGQKVLVTLGAGETLRGVAVDVDVRGGLVVDTGSQRRTVLAGDVEHVRPGTARATA